MEATFSLSLQFRADYICIVLRPSFPIPFVDFESITFNGNSQSMFQSTCQFTINKEGTINKERNQF